MPFWKPVLYVSIFTIQMLYISDIMISIQDKAATFVLTDGMGGNRNTVVISAKYIPVDITLEPRESVNSELHFLLRDYM